MEAFFRPKVQFFESYFSAEKSSNLRVIIKKSGFNSLSNVEKKGSISMSHVEENDLIL